MADLSFGQQIGLNAFSQGAGLVKGAIQGAIQNKYNKNLADYQFDKNLEMWNTQNEYNTPSAQRERFEAAGLNPALMYGGGSVSAGNANSAPQYQQNPIDLIGAFQNSMMNDMQLRQMAKNIEKTDADIEYTKSQTEGQNIANEYAPQTAQATINNLLQQAATSKSVEHLNYEQAKEVPIRIDEALSRIAVNDETIAKMQLEKESIQKDVELKDLQKSMIPLQKVLLHEQAVTERSKQYQLDSAGDLAQYQGDSILAKLPVEIANIEAGTSKLLAETNSTELGAIMQSWKNEYYKQYGVFPDASQEQFVLQTLLSGNEEVEQVGKVYKRNKQADTFQKIGIGAATVGRSVNEIVNATTGNDVNEERTYTYDHRGNRTSEKRISKEDKRSLRRTVVRLARHLLSKK